ncbi:MAG: TolC family protein [Planctomycetota bacterium]|jgi:outer membrane protein TolC
MRYEFLRCVLWIGIFCLIAGCRTDLSRTVEQTDADVYAIIDETWTDAMGDRSNYRIPDTGLPEAEGDSNGIAIQIELSPSNVLTLPQAVSLATTHNRAYATEKEQLYLTALDLIDARHIYEPIPFGGGRGGLANDGDNRGAGGFGHLGIQRLLATGAQVSGDISMGWMDIISGDFRSGFSTVATAMVTQPLLRGSSRKIVMENLTQAQRNTLYQIRYFNRYRKEFVTSIISDYYRLLQLNDESINAGNHYNTLVEMYATLEKRALAGRLPKHELEQADQDKLAAFADYMQSQRDYKNALDAFKLQLAIGPNVRVSLDMHELEALKESVSSHLEISEEEAIGITLAQRLDLMNAADRVDDARRKVDVAADAIRTELNLIGYNDSETSNRTVFDTDPGELRKTRDRYEVGLQLDLPLDRLAEKTAYRRSLIAFLQQERAFQETFDTLILEVQRACRQVEEARHRYDVESESSQLAMQRTKNTLLLLQYDRANTRDVLDAQEDFLKARNASTEAAIDYAIACLEFFRDTGTMKIKPDGMWEAGQLSEITLTKKVPTSNVEKQDAKAIIAN